MTEQARGLPCRACSRMGHSCYTERMVDGIPMCIFCEDQVECPYFKEQRTKKAKAAVVPKSKTRKKP